MYNVRRFRRVNYKNNCNYNNKNNINIFSNGVISDKLFVDLVHISNFRDFDVSLNCLRVLVV